MKPEKMGLARGARKERDLFVCLPRVGGDVSSKLLSFP
jgi:hypothetical protein